MNGIARWGLIAFTAWWIINDPASAGHVAGNLGHLAARAASGFATVLSGI